VRIFYPTSVDEPCPAVGRHELYNEWEVHDHVTKRLNAAWESTLERARAGAEWLDAVNEWLATFQRIRTDAKTRFGSSGEQFVDMAHERLTYDAELTYDAGRERRGSSPVGG